MGARFSAPVQTGPGAHPVSYTMGTGFLSPGVKRPGRDVDHPLHLAPKLKEYYSYTTTPPLGFSCLLYGDLYLYCEYCDLSLKENSRRVFLQNLFNASLGAMHGSLIPHRLPPWVHRLWAIKFKTHLSWGGGQFSFKPHHN